MSARYVAGHRIRDLDGRCEACGISVHDVMSAAVGAKPGDMGIACSGALNSHEVQQIADEVARRERMWAEVVGVAA